MDKKFLLVIICSIIVWLYYLTLSTIVGADSYFYLNMVCEITPKTDANLLFGLLTNIIPCSLIAIKTIYLGLWLITLGITYKIGTIFDRTRAWWFPAILFAFTFFITEYWKFENDAFGFTLAFAGFYFILKHSLNNKWLDWQIIKQPEIWIGLTLFVLSGLFWKGTIYWFYALGIINIAFLPFVLIAFALFWLESLFFLGANPMVYESIPFLSIIFFGLTIFFVYGIWDNRLKINLMLGFLLVPALIVNKLFILPLIFLTITSVNGIKMIKSNPIVNQTLIIFVCLMTLFWCVNLSLQFPQQQDLNLINVAVGIDKNINNTFGAGYIIINQGGTPEYTTTYSGEPTKKGVVIDVSDKNIPTNCVLKQKTRYLLLEVCE